MSWRPRLKICGVTNIDDARLISASGADYCGILVDVGFSERSIPLSRAREVASASTIPVVVLLCDPQFEVAQEIARQIKPHAVQLLCGESPELVQKLKSRLPCHIWKSVHLPTTPGQASPEEYALAGVEALVVDSVDTSEGFLRLGGTGKTVDWQAAATLVNSISIPVFLAGGVSADNVQSALIQVRPFGIDLCTGVESTKGKKDANKLYGLVDRFNAAIEALEGDEK
jgi:phosphoribosylanthranilate isomerase